MWNALTSSSNFVLESLETFAESTGVAGLFANMGWGSLIMICVAFFLLYLAIKHKFEPLLLLTIAFGMLLTNLPGANLYHTELFAGGHVHWDIFVAKAGLLDYLYLGVKLGIVQKSGAWFNYGDIRLGQGRDNAKQFLKDNPEIANDIEGQIRANADKLYASRRPAGKGAAAKAEEPAKAADAKEPVVKAPTRSSESELDIMVED